MNFASFLRGTVVLGLLVALEAPTLVGAATVSPGAVAQAAPQVDPQTKLHNEIVGLLRQRVKYVFVIFQENRSFDSYFGSFPGARNLFSQAPSQTPGYDQTLLTTSGMPQTIAPFRIGQAQYAADTDDVDHSFTRMEEKMDVVNGTPKMDRFASVEEMKYTTAGGNPTLKAKQYGELTMAYEDCDTIPFLWYYANRFVLFDNYFQHTIGPSTPNAIDMIAGQTGETQWVEHPDQASNNPTLAALGQGEPVADDNDPFWGSAASTSTVPQPINPGDNPNSYQLNQTYASLPLTFNGNDIINVTGFDTMSSTDLADVQADIPTIAALKKGATPWGWYQEGYDKEPTGGPLHQSYIGHHNGPQYFGYVSNNPVVTSNLHGLNDFFVAMANQSLSPDGGVTYLRGGYQNLAGLHPADPDAAVQANFNGDDDHPGYSDANISEALVAREVNAIVGSPYWSKSAILITYDESEGDYDSVPPLIQEANPAGLPLVHGPRIPLIVISPFAKAHKITHESGDHNSIIKLIDEIYGLPYLADLPAEAAARKLGAQKYGQPNLGPDDDQNDFNSDLLSAFDVERLKGTLPPLPGAYARIPAADVDVIPPYHGHGCASIGVIPEDVALGIHNSIPKDFNPRPGTDPTTTSAPATTSSLRRRRVL